MTAQAFKLEKLARLVSKADSWNPAARAIGQRIHYIDLSAVDNKQKRITTTQEIDAENAPSRARQLVKTGDVLVSTVRPNLNGVARVTDELEGATASTGFCVLRPDSTRLVAEYLYHWVTSPSFVEHMTKRASGQSYPAVSDRIIVESEIPLPPLDEQRRIAAILDQADALRRKRRDAVETLERLSQTLFRDRFGDLRVNSKNWPVKPFAEVCTNEDFRRRPVKSSDREKRKGTFPYYGASGIIDYVDEYIFDGDRLLIGEDGANLIARSTPIAFIASGKYWVNNHAHVLASNGLADLRFLEYFFMQMNLEPYLSGSAQPKLNQANLDRIPVPVPPPNQQQKFVSELKQLEGTQSSMADQVVVLDALFLSLQHRAFRGGFDRCAVSSFPSGPRHGAIPHQVTRTARTYWPTRHLESVGTLRG